MEFHVHGLGFFSGSGNCLCPAKAGNTRHSSVLSSTQANTGLAFPIREPRLVRLAKDSSAAKCWHIGAGSQGNKRLLRRCRIEVDSVREASRRRRRIQQVITREVSWFDARQLGSTGLCARQQRIGPPTSVRVCDACDPLF